jgi:hypothetical protein
MPSRVSSPARRTLAVGSYGILVAIIAGYIDLIPTVEQSIDRAGRAGQIGVGVALAAVAVAAMVCWVGAIWYAASIGRRGLAVLLGLTNFVGGFFFYFGYVIWRTNIQAKPPNER